MAGQTIADVYVAAHVDSKRMRPEIESAAGEAGRSGGEKLGDGIVRGVDGKLRDSHGKFVASGKRAGDGFGKGFGDSGVFATVAKVMASRLVLLGGAAALATPSVLGLVSAMAPATGILAGLPAVLAGGAVALGTFKLATFGVSDAIGKGLYGSAKAYSKALEDLPPAQRAVTETLVGLKPAIQDVRNVMGERFFQPMVSDIQPLIDTYMPLLKQEMSGVASAMGGFGHQVLQTAKSGPAVNAVRDAFRNTGEAIKVATGGVEPLGGGIARMVSATTPFLVDMAKGFVTLATRTGEWLTKASESGRFTQMWEAAKQTLRDLGGIIGDVFAIFREVLAAANVSGGSFLSNLRGLTTEAANFFQSAKGGDALRVFFASLAQIGAALKTGLAAVLPAIAQSVQVLAPALAGLAGPAAQIVVALAPLLPLVAGLAATVLTALTPAIAAIAGWMSRNADVVKVLAIALGGLFVAFKAIGAVQAAGGLAAWIAKAVLGTTVTGGLAGATTAFGVALKIATGPIGLIVVGLAGLVTAVVLLWQKNEAFRNFIIAAWDAIKAGVGAVVGWFQTSAMPVLTEVWKKIAEGAKFMWENFIRPSVEAIIHIFKTALAPAATWLWQNILRPAFEGIGKEIAAAWAVIRPILEVLVWTIKNVVAPVIGWLWNNIVEPAFRVMGVLVQAWWAVVRLVFDALVVLFKNVIGPVFNWLWHNVVEPVFNGIRNVIQGGWNAIKTIFEALKNFVTQTIPGAFQSMRDGVVNRFNAMKDGLASAWNAIKSVTFDPLARFITETIPNAFRNGVDAITNAWNKVRDAAKVPVKFVVDNVINPLIGGFNAVSGVFNGPQISKIGGFESGGRIPGPPSDHDNRLAKVVGGGSGAPPFIKVATGEFIVNARSTAENLPWLQAINSAHGKLKVGGVDAMRDGLPGFDDGGFFGAIGGFFKKVYNGVKGIGGFIADPIEGLKKLFDSAMNAIPGAGHIIGVLKGMGSSIFNNIVNKIKGWFGADGKGIVGQPGNWPSGPGAQRGDSGVWRSIVAAIESSGIKSGSFGNAYRPGDPLWHGSGRAVDWMGFNQDALATWLAQRNPLELIHRTAQRDYAYTRGQNQGSFDGPLMEAHRNHIHIAMRKGGLVGGFKGGGLVPIAQVARADFGSVTLQRGWNMVQNATGKPEPLSATGGSERVEALLRQLIAVAQVQGEQFAAALAGNSRTAYQRARALGPVMGGGMA